MDPGPGLIAVGRVVRPQGRRGEVRLEPLTDEPARLRELTECYLVPPEAGERRRIEAVWFQETAPVVKLDGVDTLDAAEVLVGRLISIPRDAVRPLPSGRFYPFELEGCAVRTPDGTVLGTVAGVLAGEGEGHDLWVLRTGTREHLVPAVGAIVEQVDLRGRAVVIRPPDGLLELE
jgi:16S rRNA processing protein RimM